MVNYWSRWLCLNVQFGVGLPKVVPPLLLKQVVDEPQEAQGAAAVFVCECSQSSKQSVCPRGQACNLLGCVALAAAAAWHQVMPWGSGCGVGSVLGREQGPWVDLLRYQVEVGSAIGIVLYVTVVCGKQWQWSITR